MGIHQRHNLANMEVPGVTLEENLKGNRFKGLILNKQPLFKRDTDTVIIPIYSSWFSSVVGSSFRLINLA